MSDIPPEEHKAIRKALAEATREVREKYNLSMSISVWRNTGDKSSNVIMFRR